MIMKLLLWFLVAFLFFQVFAEASLDHGISNLDDQEVTSLHKHRIIRRRPRINCHFACARRCSKSSRKNVCHRACGTCCLRCHCVPPGTYGNTHTCPCYAGLKTHGKKLKCP
uniref:Snakin 6 n=1 Tax=Allium cepa TaxID=4679 RepID=A0A7D5SIE7_ALLCE|nr:snakin 6 [Allium cepa]